MKSKKDFKLVKCSKKYWEYVRILRTDERVMRGFVETKKITAKEQNIYMEKNAKYYRVALVNDEPAGYVGVINNDIRICTHPDFQNIGLGKFMVKECLKIWPNAYAKIKTDNTKSIRLFKSLGFKKKYVIYTLD
jgi:RimJ/RimL family protein N-acetyltransferase